MEREELIGAVAGIILLIDLLIFIGMVCLTYHVLTIIGLNGYCRVFASLAVTLTWFTGFQALRKISKTEIKRLED